MPDTAIDFETAKSVACSGTDEERAFLARDTATAPELLYFFAKDPSVMVRRAIAENPSTPRQADLVLCHDPDTGVRCLLARKIVGTGLEDDQRSQLRRMGFTILETLMRDQAIRVRRALADGLKYMMGAPPDLVRGLARDEDARVAAPLLRHSPVLDDDDLVEIVEDGAPDWAHQAIAAREHVSERVSAALVNAGADPTVTRLLKNGAAEIGEPALEDIVERAPMVEAWHEPLVRRPSLPARLVRKIAGFVSGPLNTVLSGKAAAPLRADNWNEPPRGHGSQTAGERKAGWSPARKMDDGKVEGPKERALQLHRDGTLTDSVIEMALNANEREFVIAALALRAGVHMRGVQRIVGGASGKGMTALCWKAGVPMRFAIELQRRLARVPPSKVVLARDGVDYPFTEEDMKSRLELLLT